MIRLRDNGICQLCKIEYRFNSDRLNIDHIIPRSIFAFSHPFNLQVLCSDCNAEKYKHLDLVFNDMFINAYERTKNQWNDDIITKLHTALTKHYHDISMHKWYQIGYSSDETYQINELKSLCKDVLAVNQDKKYQSSIVNYRNMKNAINELMKYCTVLSFNFETRMNVIENLQKIKDFLKSSGHRINKVIYRASIDFSFMNYNNSSLYGWDELIIKSIKDLIKINEPYIMETLLGSFVEMNELLEHDRTPLNEYRFRSYKRQNYYSNVRYADIGLADIYHDMFELEFNRRMDIAIGKKKSD